MRKETLAQDLNSGDFWTPNLTKGLIEATCIEHNNEICVTYQHTFFKASQ